MEKENNLYDLISDLFKNKRKQWEYHEYALWNDIFEANNCHDFIKSYLGQAATLPEPDSLADILSENHFDQIDSIRYQHIVFTFFLGIKIYEKCGSIRKAIINNFCNAEEYKEALEKHRDDHNNMYRPFAYIWFLICLFHDLGYQFEEDKKGKIRKFDTYTQLVEETILVPKNEEEKQFHNRLDVICGVPDFFTQELIEKYYNYRRYGMNTYDHGIIGGMYLFHDLCKIRREHAEKEPKKVKNGYWKKELEEVFRLASSIVLCHNVFLPSNLMDDELIGKYKKFGLDELVHLAEKSKEGQYPFKMEEHPIFFLFCLVDTLEAIKVVKNTDYLKHISWDIQDDSITISTDLTCGCKDRILDNARSLKDWLCQTVDINKTSVKISFSNLQI